MPKRKPQSKPARTRAKLKPPTVHGLLGQLTELARAMIGMLQILQREVRSR